MFSKNKKKNLFWGIEREFLEMALERFKCFFECFQNNNFVELKTVMFFIALKVWITINDRANKLNKL